MSNVIISRNNIQLVKNNNPKPIPKNIKVIIQQNKSLDISKQVSKNIAAQQQQRTIKQPTIITSPSIRPQTAAISNKKPSNRVSPQSKMVVDRVVKKKNGAKLQYVSHDISDASKEKIRKLRNRGVGRVLVIIANGPSINQVELGKLRGLPGIDTLSINKPDMRIWPTTYWAFCDPSQYTAHAQLWDSYNGIIINTTGISQQKESSLQIRHIGGPGFSTDLTKGFHIGRSTTYANMQTALWMGYDKIYIFGIDMCEVDGQLHFYGVNPAVPPDKRKERFLKESQFYAQAAEWLDDQTRSKFVFCSSYNTWAFVDKFCRLDHKIAVDHIINNHCR